MRLIIFPSGLKNFFSVVFKSRGDLEQQSIETSNTSEAVGFITYVQSLKRKMKNWEKDVEVHFVVYFMFDILNCGYAALAIDRHIIIFAIVVV